MTTTRLRPTVALALLLLGALWLSAAIARPAAAADDGARWTVKPADNRFGPDRKDYGYTLSPGGRQEDGIVVANQGATTLHLTLRPADGVAPWVHLERTAVTVEPGASITVPFTVAPPKNAAAGDHAGGIVTSVDGVAAAPRLAIRLRVSGPLQPQLSVTGIHMHYSNTANPFGQGDATVTYTIRNTGNATLTAKQSVSASGPFGAWTRHAARLPDAPALPPGATWRGSARLAGVTPALRQKATVTVIPLLTDAAGSTAPLPATTGSAHALTIPWALLLLLVVVLGPAGAVLHRRRRGHVGAPRHADRVVA